MKDNILYWWDNELSDQERMDLLEKYSCSELSYIEIRNIYLLENEP